MQNDRNETLIAVGVTTARQIQVLRARLQDTENQMNGQFQGVATREEISCTAGTAERVVTREYSIKKGHLKEVRNILGPTLQHLLDDEYPCTLGPEIRAMVKKDSHPYGMRIRPHVIVETTVRVHFREPLSGVIVTDGTVSEVIDLAAIEGDDNA